MGIKRFQDQKHSGQWFDVLLPLMKRKVTCQTEQAIEPSASETTASSPDLEAAADGSDDTTDNDIMDNVKEKPKPASDNLVANKSLFVPVRSRSSGKSSVSKKIETTNSQISDVLGQIKTVLEGEKTQQQKCYIFFERENERARQHDLDLFRIMFQPNTVNQQTPKAAQQTQAATVHQTQAATIQKTPAATLQQISTTAAQQIPTAAVHQVPTGV